MQRWQERPVEVANLFNPAFCGIILQSALRGFQLEQNGGMPYPLLFLVLPVVLHSYTRSILPKTISTKMHVWLQTHPEVRVGFVERTRNLVPYTKESLIFGIYTEIISIENNGCLVWIPKSLRKTEQNSEIARLQKRAIFLGRWMAQCDESSNIFTMWGIRP